MLLLEAEIIKLSQAAQVWKGSFLFYIYFDQNDVTVTLKKPRSIRAWKEYNCSCNCFCSTSFDR